MVPSTLEVPWSQTSSQTSTFSSAGANVHVAAKTQLFFCFFPLRLLAFGYSLSLQDAPAAVRVLHGDAGLTVRLQVALLHRNLCDLQKNPRGENQSQHSSIG